MNELVKVTKNEQGSQVVSARELYQFLGMDSSQWKRWAVKNIEGNQFVLENTDWEGFDIVSNGNPTKDYALSLDFAKRISMMAKTAKGEEIRNYFIDCEKQLNKPKTQIELIIESAIALQEHETRLSVVESKLLKIEENKQLALSELNHIERSPNEVPEIGLRLKINKIVRSYSEKNNISYHDIWRSMYSKMLYAYRFNVNAYKKLHDKESKMDIVERENQLDNLFTLVSKELV